MYSLSGLNGEGEGGHHLVRALGTCPAMASMGIIPNERIRSRIVLGGTEGVVVSMPPLPA